MISDRILASLEWLRGLSQEYMRIEVIKPGDPAEHVFMTYLIGQIAGYDELQRFRGVRAQGGPEVRRCGVSASGGSNNN